jgi:hypothetical protein
MNYPGFDMTANDGRSAGGKVIAMDRFRSGRSLSPLRQAEAYWSALRDGDGAIPLRSRIDPRGLGNILAQAFILEQIAPGLARFRLAGQTLNDLAGMEVRGMPLTALFVPAARPGVSAILTAVFDRPALAELSLTAEPCPGRPAAEARMILLPLRGASGESDRALGVMVADIAGGAPPWRFDIADSRIRPVNGPQAPAPAPVPGFAEAQTPLGGRAPHLRLVK